MINPEMHSGGGYRSSNEIESDIRRTRGRMDATLDELSQQLTARSIVNLLLDVWDARSARSARTIRHEEPAEIHIHAEGHEDKTSYAKSLAKKQAKKAFRGLAHQIQENPIPSLLIGAGVAWMLFQPEEDEREYVELSGRRYRVNPAEPSGPLGAPIATPATAYEYEEVEYEDIDTGPGVTDKAKEKLAHGKEAVSEAAESVKEKLSEMGSAASHAAHRAADRVRGTSRSTYYRGRSGSHRMAHQLKSGYYSGAERFEDAVDEHPLAVGIGFAALGALVGLLLPHTRREDELLGERSDELIHTAKEKGKETLEQSVIEKGKDILERGKTVAKRVAEATIEEAAKQGFTGGGSLSEKAGEVGRRVKEEVKTAAEDEGLKSKPEASSSTSSTGLSSGSSGQSVTMPPKSASQQGGNL